MPGRGSYRLLSYDSLTFHSHVGTRASCEKRKTSHTRGRRRDPMVAYYRVSVFPVEVDPVHPRRLLPEVIDRVNEWRSWMGKRKLGKSPRTREPRHYQLATLAS